MISRRRLLTVCLALVAGVGASLPAAAAEPGVVIVLSDDSAVYRETATAIEQSVAAAGIGSGRFTIVGSKDVAAGRDARLMIAVGTRALDAVLDSDTKSPVLAVLIPRESFERRAVRGDGRRLSAVFIDQPMVRQLDIVTMALPDKRRLGVVAGPESQRQLAALQTAAAQHGLRVVSAIVSSEREVFPAIERVIGDADVLLALPDPLVFNAGTIQNILLAAYRRQVPMVGFSPAYLRAGALLTLQSSPTQVAVSAVDAVRAALAGRPLPPPRFPREFSVTVNRHVARSLGLRLDDDDALTARLQAQEGAR